MIVSGVDDCLVGFHEFVASLEVINCSQVNNHQVRA